MNVSQRRRRVAAEGELAPEEEAAPRAPHVVENVLGLQRSVGNAAVSRQLGVGVGGARTIARSPSVSAADQSVGRSLARTASKRSVGKRPDPGGELAELEPDEADEFEDQEAELAQEPQSAASAAPASATLGRKTKAPPVPKIKSKTQFKAPSGGRSRGTIGVGEQVTFSGNVAGAWTASDGTPAASAANGKKFVWTATDRAATVTITLTVGTQSATKTMTVIEPAAITASKIKEVRFASGEQGAGMELRFKYHPLTVSFGNIEVKEVSGPPTNITGYYTTTPIADLWHDSGETFTRIGKDNKDTGIDTAQEAGAPPPWTDGTFDWVIPNNFRTIHEGDTNGTQFTTVTHATRIEGPPKPGRTTVSKGGQTVRRSP